MGPGEDLYVSHSLMWEIIIRMVLIPMVLFFLAHRYLLSGRLIEIREGASWGPLTKDNNRRDGGGPDAAL